MGMAGTGILVSLQEKNSGKRQRLVISKLGKFDEGVTPYRSGELLSRKLSVPSALDWGVYAYGVNFSPHTFLRHIDTWKASHT